MIPMKIHNFVVEICEKAGLVLCELEENGSFFRRKVNVAECGGFVSFFYRSAYVTYMIDQISNGFMLFDISLKKLQPHTSKGNEDYKLPLGRFEFTNRGVLKTKGSYCTFHQLQIGTVFASEKKVKEEPDG